MFGIVINKNGYKTEFVVLNEDKTPQFYELKDDEKIIEKDWEIANSLLKAKWNEEKQEWVEGATEEEIQTWKDSQPKHPTPIKTNEELERELADLEIQLLLK